MRPPAAVAPELATSSHAPAIAPTSDAPLAAARAPVVVAEGLTRTFARRRAVDAVSLTLGAGDCLALFGPNGAGKSTLLRLLAGLLRPTAGRASVAGVALPGGSEARGAVGFLSHHSMLYAPLTVRENVEFSARLYGVRDPVAATSNALARMRVLDRASSAVSALSRGLQQRVSVARAVVHGPRVLLLDEPYTGLDDAGSAALTRLLEDLKASGVALVLVTHHLHEGLALATHVAVMRGGRLVRQDARAAIDPARYAAEYRALVADEPAA